MDFEKAQDKELVEEAQTGLRGQGAVVEMMRRLKDSIDKLESSTSNYSRWLIVLTLVIAILTLILLFKG